MDYYSILEVSTTADNAEIRQAYKKLALIWHPDKVPSHQRDEAELKFKAISEAYEILGNDESRMIYDAEQQFGGQSWQDFYAEATQDYGQDYNPDADYFGGHFDSQPKYHHKSNVNKTSDIIFETSMTLEEVYVGKILKLTTERNVVCRKCNGLGGRKQARKHKCYTCNGTGSTRRSQMVGRQLFQTDQITCPNCNGKGLYYADKDLCRRCKGSTLQPLKSSIEVYIPKGIKNNHQIILPNQADEEVGKTTGDLIIEVKVEAEHPTFRRMGLDLYASTSISLIESLSGFNKVLVYHLDERPIKVEVPKGVCVGPNQILKINGEGLTMQLEDKSEVKGDLYVQVQVEFPRTLPNNVIDEISNLLTTAIEPTEDQNDDTLNDDVKCVEHEIIDEYSLPEYDADVNDEPPQAAADTEKQPGGCVIM